jgi:glycosyltransferase involved in cell wall biosynthesis
MTQANLTLRGGAERVVLKIAEHYKAPIYTAEYDPDRTFFAFKNLDVRVISEGKKGIIPYGRAMQGLKYGLSFYNYKIKEDYDVINAHIAPSHWIRNRNERVLWYCHTPLRDIYDLYKYRMSLKKIHQKPVYGIGAAFVKMMDRNVVKEVEAIYTNSSNTESRIEKYLKRNDATVLGGGIDAKDYRNAGDEKYFFYPSRISPNKRQDYAIRAFRSLRKNGGGKGYKLIIAGATSKDPLYNNYYIKIKEMAKGDRDIRILENITDKELKSIYSRASAVLYCPIDEDYGLVPLEAMASGKPVISVNEGGPRDTVADGKTGFLVNNEYEMGKRMGELASSPALGEKMGKEGRRLVQKKYSWAAFFREFDIGLKRVAKGSA